jgi:hypothetical protein
MMRVPLLVFAVPAVSKTVTIATFDGAEETTLPFQTVNDPVMGGQSTSSFSVSDDKGIFEGEVKVVTFLGSPGFCNLEAPGYRQEAVKFPDLSGTDGINVEMKQTAKSGLTNWDVSIQTETSQKASQTGDAGWQADFTYSEGTTSYFVPYSSFKCSSRGRPLTTCGSLSEQLQELTQIGIGSDGIAGSFRVELTSISAVSSGLSEATAATKLATFDGAKETELKWVKTLDPVMGGGSTGDFSITSNGTAKFSGQVNIVSFLKAPGFAKIEGSASNVLRDITGAEHILLKLRSSTPAYQGFKVALGAPGVPSDSPFQRQGAYKSEFNLTDSNDWQVVSVPLSHFSYDTSDYTGRCDSKDPNGKQHYCCDKSGFQPSNSEVCIDSKYLSVINDLQVWAEGVEGDFDLEIEWIGASVATVLV